MEQESDICDRLVNHFGNISATSRALGFSRQHIHAWINAGFIPFKHGKLVEEKTSGAITAIEVWETAAKSRHH